MPLLSQTPIAHFGTADGRWDKNSDEESDNDSIGDFEQTTFDDVTHIEYIRGVTDFKALNFRIVLCVSQSRKHSC